MGEIVIPASVAGEVVAGNSRDPARLWLQSIESKGMVQDDVEASKELMGWDLGDGETAVIAWCKSRGNYYAVLDDAAGRRCARVFEVKTRGTLTLVALAKRRGFIPHCRPVFERLQAEGLFITERLVEQVAKSVGE
jgi:predicted nucleic acid-binding protein